MCMHTTCIPHAKYMQVACTLHATCKHTKPESNHTLQLEIGLKKFQHMLINTGWSKLHYVQDSNFRRSSPHLLVRSLFSLSMETFSPEIYTMNLLQCSLVPVLKSSPTRYHLQYAKQWATYNNTTLSPSSLCYLAARGFSKERRSCWTKQQ